jgi:hypothetical protein
MNKKQGTWFGLAFCLLALMLGAYCEYRASFANLHILMAEKEDLDLFPELGREIQAGLYIMMGIIIALAGFTATLLSKRPESSKEIAEETGHQRYRLENET